MVGLELRDLGASYGGREVLSGITTPKLTGGQVVSLLGPNGAGKSTLFRRIFGILKGAGEVRIEGASSPRPIAYMPQDDGGRPALSVYEAVLLARMQGRRLQVSGEDHAEVDRVIALLDMGRLRGRPVGDLSGGQRQIVGVAQALVQRPQIVLMDEPTSALDLSRQIGLQTLMRSLAREQGLLVMIAQHDLGHALRFTDACLVIAEGGLAACGPTGEVITPALLRDIFEVEARVERCSKGIPQLMVDHRLGDLGVSAGRNLSKSAG
ncbi:ferrichrome ABC transporter [Alloyangia pacifica]|uniref:Ferrichrome ABC transporter n=1 Tax=Alloyangia pacifica TaxID=311180 RepID=A0A2U8HB05_9RHOB|nr:ABC transporter ATP-binding protein [Alloyangia pacifica]AWI82893.1 ferrichrome ABC transporter [Alloyangia pacifica]